MTIDENIFNLYGQLNKDGARGEALSHISKICGVKKLTVKNHWFHNGELPDRLEESKKAEIVTYLQNVIALQNEAIKNIEVA